MALEDLHILLLRLADLVADLRFEIAPQFFLIAGQGKQHRNFIGPSGQGFTPRLEMAKFDPPGPLAQEKLLRLFEQGVGGIFILRYNAGGIKIGQATEMGAEQKAFLGDELQDAGDLAVASSGEIDRAIAIGSLHNITPERTVVDRGFGMVLQKNLPERHRM